MTGGTGSITTGGAAVGCDVALGATVGVALGVGVGVGVAVGASVGRSVATGAGVGTAVGVNGFSAPVLRNKKKASARKIAARIGPATVHDTPVSPPRGGTGGDVGFGRGATVCGRTGTAGGPTSTGGARCVGTPVLGRGIGRASAIATGGSAAGVRGVASAAIWARLVGAWPRFRATIRKASVKAPAESKRFSGFFARIRAMTASNSGGNSASNELGGGGDSWMWATIRRGVAPVNGTRPVSIS